MNTKGALTSPSPDKEILVAAVTDQMTGAAFSLYLRQNREISIQSRTVQMGLWKKRAEPGYLLKNGFVLLESEKDMDGSYIGGAGINGMYTKTPHRFLPVLDESGQPRAFRDVTEDFVLIAERQDGKRFTVFLGTKTRCLRLMEDQAQLEDFFACHVAGKSSLYDRNEKHKWNWAPTPKKEREIVPMKSSAKDIHLTPVDELFQSDEERKDARGEKIVELSLSDLHPFQNHPFQVRDDDAMQELTDSVKKSGVYDPIIVRPRKEGGYEIIAGHRRKRASELAGKETVPAIVRNLDDDTATILMCDTNLQQRETILPSERAFAYKLKLDAMKHQGKRKDLTSTPLEQKLNGKYSVEILAEQVGENRNQVQRFIRLTYLAPKLLNLVDVGAVAFRPAVELSYLKLTEQTTLLDMMEREQATPSLAQAQRLKKYSQEGKLEPNVINAILTEETKETEKIVFRGDRIKRYFPSSYTPRQMQDTILKLLEQWQRQRQKQHEMER